MQTAQLQSLLVALQEENDVNIDLISPNESSSISSEMIVTVSVARSVSQAIYEYKFMGNEPTTTMNEIFDQVKDINQKYELLALVNSTEPLDNGSTRAEASILGLMEIYNNSFSGENVSSNSHHENDGSFEIIIPRS